MLQAQYLSRFDKEDTGAKNMVGDLSSQTLDVTDPAMKNSLIHPIDGKEILRNDINSSLVRKNTFKNIKSNDSSDPG
jgi:hypothetical protein